MVATIPGELYKHEASFFTQSTNGIEIVLDGEWYDKDGNSLTNAPYNKSNRVIITNNDSWVTLTMYNRCPQNAVYLTVRFLAKFYDAEDILYVDNMSFFGKSSAIPGGTVTHLHSRNYDKTPCLDVINLTAAAGMEVIVDKYNFFMDLDFDHIDTSAYGPSGTWDNTDFDHYEVYYAPSGSDWITYGNVVITPPQTSGASISYKINHLGENTNYNVMVKTCDLQGNRSSGAALYNILSSGNKFPHAPEFVDDKCSFLTENAEIFWNPVTTNEDDTSSAIGGLSSDTKDYKIEVVVGGTEKRVEYTNATHYTYKLGNNKSDNGTPNPVITFNIYTRDFGDKISSGTQKILTNYAPDIVEGLTADFTTKDAIFWWNPVITDSEDAALLDFDTYVLTITPSGGSPTTLYTQDARYTYKFEDNVDNIPNVNLKVQARDKFAQLGTSGNSTAINSVPDKGPTPEVQTGFKKVLIHWTSPEEIAQLDSDEKDVERIQLWSSGNSDYSLLSEQTNNFFVHDVELNSTHKYKVRFIDCFGQSGSLSEASNEAFTNDYITLRDMEGSAYQLIPTSSYEDTYIGASDENDISRLYDSYSNSYAYFGSGEQWIEYEFPVSHTFNKAVVNFPTDNIYKYFYAYRPNSGDSWIYVAGGDHNNLVEYVDTIISGESWTGKTLAYQSLITASGTQAVDTFDYMRDARYWRFYFPSGDYVWDENKLCELKFSTYVIADEIDTGTINLAKGINLYNNETGSGFHMDETGAFFENGYISVLGDGYTIIQDGEIWVKSSGASSEGRLNDFFEDEEGTTRIRGGYIKTGTIDTEILRIMGKGYFQNYVRNPSLEVPNTLDTVPSEWEIILGSSGSFTYGNNAAFAKYGRRYAEFSPGSGGMPCDFYIRTSGSYPDGKYIIPINNDALEGRYYTISCYASTDSNSYAEAWVDEVDQSGSTIASHYLCSAWGAACLQAMTRHVVTFTPSSGSSGILFNARQDQNMLHSGSVRFDAFQLEEGNQVTDFKVTYELGTVVIDSSGIVVDHGPNKARTIINADGITVERGSIFINNSENIDLTDQISIGDNLIYNPTFSLTKFDGDKRIPEGWNLFSGSYPITSHYSVETGNPINEEGIGISYLKINPSGSGIHNFSSMKIPVEENSIYSLSTYYYVPSGTSDLDMVFYLYYSTNSNNINSLYDTSSDNMLIPRGDVFEYLYDGDYPVIESIWREKQWEDIRINNDGYLYIMGTVNPDNDCVTTDVRFTGIRLERGDRCTKRKQQEIEMIEKKLSLYKKGMAKSMQGKYIIEGLDLSIG